MCNVHTKIPLHRVTIVVQTNKLGNFSEFFWYQLPWIIPFILWRRPHKIFRFGCWIFKNDKNNVHEYLTAYSALTPLRESIIFIIQQWISISFHRLNTSNWIRLQCYCNTLIQYDVKLSVTVILYINRRMLSTDKYCTPPMES